MTRELFVPNLPVIIDHEPFLANCELAGDDDVDALKSIRAERGISRISDPDTADQIAYILSARAKWMAEWKKGRVGFDTKTIDRFITDNPHAEVSSMLMLRCTIRSRSRVLGMCLFHRTWNGNVCIDFLTAVPWMRTNGTKHDTGGVGTALLYSVCKLADRIGAHRLWCETSPTSRGYYKKVLKLANVDDLMRASREKYRQFMRSYAASGEIGVQRHA